MAAYGPTEFLANLAGGAVVILPYVAVAVTGALVLLFTFIGIRSGIRFFRGAADVPLPTGYSTYEGGSAGMNPDPTAYDE